MLTKQFFLTYQLSNVVWRFVQDIVDRVVPEPLGNTVARGTYRNDGLVINDAELGCTIRSPREPRHPNLDKFLKRCAG
jgi:hypothetical protein